MPVIVKLKERMFVPGGGAIGMARRVSASAVLPPPCTPAIQLGRVVPGTPLQEFIAVAAAIRANKKFFDSIEAAPELTHARAR